MEHQFKVYLEESLLLRPDRHHRSQLIALALLLYILCPLALTFLSLDNVTRLTLCDQFLYFHLPATFNWLIISTTLNTLYFHCVMHLRPTALQLLAFLHRIIFRKDGRFFLFQKVLHAHAYLSPCEAIRRNLRPYLALMNYFVKFKYIFLFFLNLNGIIGIFTNYESFFGSLSVLSRPPLYLAASFGSTLNLETYANVHLLFSIAAYTFTLIAFQQFKQISQLLTAKQFASFRFCLFTRKHTELLGLIFAYNTFFGRLLFAYMLINFPVSLFLTLGILRGAFDPQSLPFFLNILSVHYTVFLFFHYLSAMYSTRIHACVKPLAGYSASLTRGKVQLKSQLKLVFYLEKFNTVEKYGISYASFGLVSFDSFAKFIILYSEFILYWYNLFNV